MSSLADKRLKAAAEGADVFLDTIIRFMTGDENSSSDTRKFAELLFALQGSGARTICGAHHSPKGFGRNETDINLENALRGAGDLGAMLSTAWAIKQTDEKTNRILVTNVKARDFEACGPLMLEGRPYIEKTGAFKMIVEPGAERATYWKTTKRAAQDEKIHRAKALKDQGLTDDEVAEQLGIKDRTVRRWREQGKLPDIGCPPDKKG